MSTRAPGNQPSGHLRVLIAGCGYVGSALAERLVAAGHEVWGLRRTPDGVPGGVHPFAADLSHPSTLQALPPHLDYVVYAVSPGGSSDEAYRAAYVEGVGNLLSAVVEQEQAPRRVLFTSSTGVYAQTEGEWVDEDSPTEPSSYSGQRLLEGERLLLGGPFPATVLRLGGIYGPGRTRLIEEVRAGSAACLPGTPAWSNRIHRDDCAGALHHLMMLDAPAPVYIGVDREPAPLCDILRWLADRLGMPAPPVGDAAEGSRRGRAGRRSNKRCSSTRLAESGYEMRYRSYREGFGALIEAAGG